MELGKLLVAFFIVVIFLTLLSLFTSKSQTGQFLIHSTDSTSFAFVIILFSSVIIFFIKVPKRYYRPIPSRA